MAWTWATHIVTPGNSSLAVRQDIVESGSQAMVSIIGGWGEFLTGRKALLQRGFPSKEARGCGPDHTAQQGVLMNSPVLVASPFVT